MRVGAATILVNNELGTPIQGASVNQVVNSIRDNLEANAVYIEAGDERLVLISVDVVALDRFVIDNAQKQIAERLGLDPHSTLACCTHTHSGPSVLHTSASKEPDRAYLERIAGWFADVAVVAAEGAVEATWRIGQGAAAIGYNRRCCWADGTHTMHTHGHDPHSDEFLGIEGPADPRHTALLAEDDQGKPLAVIHANSAHPTLFYGRDFLSADYPGEARQLVRNTLGNIPVLYLNGPFGDIGPTSPIRSGPAGEQRAREMGAIVAGETLRLFHNAEPQHELTLAQAHEERTVTLRIPSEDELAAAAELIKKWEAGEKVDNWALMYAHGKTILADRYGDDPREPMHVHAVRLGNVGLFTHPCELFTQFALDLKARSPFDITMVADCTNGFNGYCPTYGAYLGGGYSADTLYASRVAPDTGYRLVDTGVQLLRNVDRKGDLEPAAV